MPNQDTGDDGSDQCSITFEPSGFLFPSLSPRPYNPNDWSSSTSSSENIVVSDVDALIPHDRRNQRQLQQPGANAPSSSRDSYNEPPNHRAARAQHAIRIDRLAFYGPFGLAIPLGSHVDYSDTQLPIQSLVNSMTRRPSIGLHAQPSWARTYRFENIGIGPGGYQVANQLGRRDALSVVSDTHKVSSRKR
jgi:hypothetical protein